MNIHIYKYIHKPRHTINIKNKETNIYKHVYIYIYIEINIYIHISTHSTHLIYKTVHNNRHTSTQADTYKHT